MFSIPGLKVVSLTDAAAARIRAIMAQSGHDDPDSPALGLRVGVKKGGCAGMEYTFEVARAVNKGDEVVTEKDAT
uniref:HesB/IscA family protein n=1 Tax=Streptomyces niveiscabiei TaxID=164115 RepID=UPI0038F67FFD